MISTWACLDELPMRSPVRASPPGPFRWRSVTGREVCPLPRPTGRDYDVSMEFLRITVDPSRMGGVPCIRSLRIPVAAVLGMLADGMSDVEILELYPDLELEDIREALRYASVAVRERELPLRRAE